MFVGQYISSQLLLQCCACLCSARLLSTMLMSSLSETINCMGSLHSNRKVTRMMLMQKNFILFCTDLGHSASTQSCLESKHSTPSQRSASPLNKQNTVCRLLLLEDFPTCSSVGLCWLRRHYQPILQERKQDHIQLSQFLAWALSTYCPLQASWKEFMALEAYGEG